MAPPSRILVLDLGDVLYHYNTAGLDQFSTKTLRAIITSHEWEALERGEVGEQEALQRLSSRSDISVSPSTLRAGLDQCRASLHVDTELLSSLIAIKDEMKDMGGDLKVYAMTNVSEHDFALMQDVMTKQGLNSDFFDGVFTSFEARMRKPEARFFERVINEVGPNPSNMVFVDDKAENVDTALSLGMHGLVFKNRDELLCQLRQFLFDAHIIAGKTWLKANSRNLVNQIEDGTHFHDTFSQFLIMEATNDTSLLHLNANLEPDSETNENIHAATRTARQWNYFLRHPVGTTAQFPDDVDSTSYSLLAFTPTNADAVLDAMLSNRNADGLVQTYWDPTRPRVDTCVLTNVVRAFYKYNRGHEIQPSLTYITKALVDRAYLSGTRHYCTPEVFLFYVAHLVAEFPRAPEIQGLRETLVEAVRERVAVFENVITQAELDLEAASRAAGGEAYTVYVPEVDSLALAMRILACQLLGVRPEGFDMDVARLKEMQCEDGSWPLGWVCRYGRTKARIGNRGVVTAFAVKAIEMEALGGAGLEHRGGQPAQGSVAHSSWEVTRASVAEAAATLERCGSILKK